MGADSLIENTPNALGFIWIGLHKPFYFNKKGIHWPSVVRAPGYVRVQKNFSFFATIIAWKRTKDLAKAACHALYMS